MRLLLNLDSNLVTSDSRLFVTRAKSTPFDVVFSQGGRVVELDPTAVGNIALTVGGNLVAGGLDTFWVKSGSGASTIYSFLLDCNTTNVSDLFASSSDQVIGALSIDWSINGVPQESSKIPTAIQNANLTDEGLPSSMPDLKATTSLAEAGTDDTTWMTPLKVAQAIAAQVAAVTGVTSSVIIAALGFNPVSPTALSSALSSLTSTVESWVTSAINTAIAGLASVARTGSYADLTNKPSLFSGSYTDLTNKPTIPAAQVASDWNATSGVSQIQNKPSLFSGSYADLTNTPTIPSATVLDGTPYAVGSISGSVTLDRSNGILQSASLTAATTLLAPSNGSAGKKLYLWLTAPSGGATLTIDSAIKVPSDSSFAGTKTLGASKLYIVFMWHNGTAWMLSTLEGGY